MLKTPRENPTGRKANQNRHICQWHSALTVTLTHYAGFRIKHYRQVFRLGFLTAVSGLLTMNCNGLICRDEHGTVKTVTATRSCGNLTRFPILPYPYLEDPARIRAPAEFYV